MRFARLLWGEPGTTRNPDGRHREDRALRFRSAEDRRQSLQSVARAKHQLPLKHPVVPGSPHLVGFLGGSPVIARRSHSRRERFSVPPARGLHESSGRSLFYSSNSLFSVG